MIQRVCRSVFYYEAVLSGCSGAAYFVFPQLFPWLFVFPNEDSTMATLWGAMDSVFAQTYCKFDYDNAHSFLLSAYHRLVAVWLPCHGIWPVPNEFRH
jgi:hypothetical protein